MVELTHLGRIQHADHIQLYGAGSFAMGTSTINYSQQETSINARGIFPARLHAMVKPYYVSGSSEANIVPHVDRELIVTEFECFEERPAISFPRTSLG